MSLPTPEQERKAIAALFGVFILAGFGAGALLVLAGFVLSIIAGWVFS